MPHPATDPPDLGSKMAEIDKLPRRDIFASGKAAPIAKRVAEAKSVLKDAEVRAVKGKRGPKPKPKIGPPPWETEGISRALWYRRRRSAKS